MKTRTKKPHAARSLTATLAIAFVTLSAVVLLISGVLQMLSSIQTQQATIASQQQLTAQDAAKTVSSFIQEKFSVLETTVGLADPVTAPPEAQKQILESLLGPQPAFRQLVLLNAQDQELAKISRLSQVASGRFADQLKGDGLAQIRQGKRYISPVNIDPDTSEPMVVIAVPAMTALGDFQGTLAAEVSLKVDLWDLVDQLKVGKTGVAYVVDRQGNLIAFHDTARVLRGENVAQLAEVQEFITGIAPVAQSPFDVEQGIQGKTVIAAYAPLGTPDWAVVTEMPWQEAYQEVIRNMVASAGVILVMAALAGLVGAYLARRLAVPLINLTSTATRIASGDIELQAEIGGPSEVADLARTFNSMTAQLRELISGLETRVAERTADLERHSRYLTASTEVGRAAASILDPNQLIGQVVELIRERFELYYVGLFLIDESGQWAVLRAGTGSAGQAMLARRHKLQVGGGSMIGWSVANAQARIAQVAGQDAVRLATPELPNTRSEAALPLRSRGNTIGALTVQGDQPGMFDEATVAVLQIMADQVAVALDNARLYTESQSALEASRRAYGELSRVGWQGLLHTRGELGYRSDAEGITEATQAWSTEMEQAARTGQTVQINSDDQNRKPLAVPITVRGNVVGVLDTYKPGESGDWTPEEINLMETLAAQVAQALESARLYQDTQRRAVQERLVGEVTSRIRESLDIETVLGAALDEMYQALGLDQIVIRLTTERPANLDVPGAVRAQTELS